MVMVMVGGIGGGWGAICCCWLLLREAWTFCFACGCAYLICAVLVGGDQIVWRHWVLRRNSHGEKRPLFFWLVLLRWAHSCLLAEEKHSNNSNYTNRISKHTRVWYNSFSYTFKREETNNKTRVEESHDIHFTSSHSISANQSAL